MRQGFPGSSAGKESACNAGDTSSIPGSRRSPGEGIGYPLQYSWASLVAQRVKNPPTMREIWVRSLGWEDPQEEGMATYSSILPGKSHGQRSLAGYSPWGHKELDTTERVTRYRVRQEWRLAQQCWSHSLSGCLQVLALGSNAMKKSRP